MDRRHVRIGVFSAGVISGLLVLFYLPVLIWSPPWGLKGYYTPTTSEVLISDGKGIVSNPLYVTTNGIIKEVKPEDFFGANVPYALPSRLSDGLYTNNKSLYTKHNAQIGIKINNPFTLWYIKWLEWTAETP